MSSPMATLSVTFAALAQARSFLFVPGDRPDRYAKALAAGADAVIIDLEDAVAPEAKVQAREALRSGWPARPDAAPTNDAPADPAQPAQYARPRLLLRCNAVGTPWFDDDLALAVALRPDGLVLPKTESLAQLKACADALAAGEAQGGAPVALLPLIESAEGLAQVRALAGSGLVLRLLLGHLDLQADLGMQCGDDERELDAVRLDMVLASRLAGLPAPVDGVTTATGDAQRLATDVVRAQRFGFSGKLCIHPQQVAGVHRGLAPTPERLDWAQRVMAAVDGAAEADRGALQVDGKMVDAPVIKLAQQVLAAAR